MWSFSVTTRFKEFGETCLLVNNAVVHFYIESLSLTYEIGKISFVYHFGKYNLEQERNPSRNQISINETYRVREKQEMCRHAPNGVCKTFSKKAKMCLSVIFGYAGFDSLLFYRIIIFLIRFFHSSQNVKNIIFIWNYICIHVCTSNFIFKLQQFSTLVNW